MRLVSFDADFGYPDWVDKERRHATVVNIRSPVNDLTGGNSA